MSQANILPNFTARLENNPFGYQKGSPTTLFQKPFPQTVQAVDHPRVACEFAESQDPCTLLVHEQFVINQSPLFVEKGLQQCGSFRLAFVCVRKTHVDLAWDNLIHRNFFDSDNNVAA